MVYVAKHTLYVYTFQNSQELLQRPLIFLYLYIKYIRYVIILPVLYIMLVLSHYCRLEILWVMST